MNIAASISQQFRRSARSLLHRPGLLVVALVTLGLGIGANTAIFSIVNAVLLKPLPFKDPDRLVMVWSTARDQGLVEGSSSYLDFEDWRTQTEGFEGLAAFWTFPNGDVNLTGGSEPQRVSVARISTGFFEVLGVAPLHGRTFLADETVLGNHRRAILSYGLWRAQFGADSGVIGRDVMVNAVPYTVVGVMPPELESRSVRILGTDAQLWRPIVPNDNQTGPRESRKMRVVGRLAPGVSLPQAQAQLGAVATRLAELHPATNRDVGIRLVPVRENVVRDVRRGLVLLLVAVGVVLAGACANVANLLLMKAAGSRKQMAVQLALGASRARLAAQVLAESLLLGVMGAALGVVLAFAIVRTVAVAGPADIPLLSDARIDGAVLVFTLVATLLTVTLVGFFPAWRATRLDAMHVLRQGGDRSRGKGDRRLMRALTISQIALAMVLLTAGGLLMRSFQALMRVDPGIDPERVLTFQLELPMATVYPTQPARDVFFTTLLERIAALPGVRGVAMASAPPMEDEPSEFTFTRPDVASDRALRANYRLVTPEYFELLGIPLANGRAFEATDGRSAPRVAIVSEALARSAWAGDDPIGDRIELAFGDPAEVVGVVRDVRTTGLDGEEARVLYLPAAQRGYNFMTVLVKTDRDPQALTPAIRSVARALDPNLPLHHVRTADELVARSVAPQRFQVLLVGSFSVLVFALAVVGTYGVTSYGVSERTGELGIRVALGATGANIRRLVLREGAWLAATGIVAGALLAVGSARALAGFVDQVGTLDWVTFVAAPILMASAVLLATYFPARRATRVDPARVLRAD
jgi:putative ABC transport system permease protein